MQKIKLKLISHYFYAKSKILFAFTILLVLFSLAFFDFFLGEKYFLKKNITCHFDDYERFNETNKNLNSNSKILKSIFGFS